MTVTVSEGTEPADQITARVDDGYELYVNSELVLSDYNWLDAETLLLDLLPGDQIALRGIDNGSGPGAAFVDIQLTDGTRLATSAEWRLSLNATGDWTAADYDDSTWTAATEYGGVGSPGWAQGAAPFLPSDSPGQWIWSENIYDDNEVFLRYSLPEDGPLSLPEDGSLLF